MVINSTVLKDFLSLIGKLKVSNDILFFDSISSKFFISTGNQVIQCSYSPEDIQENEKKSYAFACKPFFHVVGSTPSFSLKSDYTYDSPLISGKIESNEVYLSELEAIKVTLSDLYKKNIVTTFDITSDFLHYFRNALMYLDKESKNIASKFIFIKDKKIISTSNYRIYQGSFDFDKTVNIPIDVATIIDYLGEGTQVSITDSNEFILRKDSFEIYLSAVSEGSIPELPLFDETHAFSILMKKILDSGFTFDLDRIALSSAIKYMKFFANSITNNKTSLNIFNKEVTLSIGENKYRLPQIQEDFALSFSLNLSDVEKIFDFLKKETEKISISVLEGSNIYISKISDNELVYLTKIVN